MFIFIKLSTCHAQLQVICHLFGTIALVMTLGEAVVLVDPVEHWLSDGDEQENSVLQYCDELHCYDEYEQSRLHGTNHGTSLT